MHELIIINLIVLFSAALQAITGFGFAVMATPLLLLLLNSTECIYIVIFLSLFMSIIMLPGIWRDIDWRLLRMFIVGSVGGAPVGVWLLMIAPVENIKLFVAILLMIVVGSSIVRRKSEKFTGISNRFTELAVGCGSGILASSIGMPGVPLAMYFSRTKTAKEQVRSTALTFYVGIYVISVALQVIADQISGPVFFRSLSLIPAALFGTFLGQRLFYKTNQKYFNILVYCIMLYTGLYMLWSMYFS